MSEYQYYEFGTVNRTLSRAEQQDVGTWSSRAEVTASSASFTYHYGDFQEKMTEILEKFQRSSAFMERLRKEGLA
jgi:hypothetical protein